MPNCPNCFLFNIFFILFLIGLLMGVFVTETISLVNSEKKNESATIYLLIWWVSYLSVK